VEPESEKMAATISSLVRETIRPGDFDTLRAAEAGRSPHLFLALRLLGGQQALSGAVDRSEIDAPLARRLRHAGGFGCGNAASVSIP
jgi:hypothetical protein